MTFNPQPNPQLIPPMNTQPTTQPTTAPAWTPGPWKYRQDEGGRPAMHSDWQVYAAGSTHDRIAPVARLELRGHQAAHNARLIAAAPELAAMLAAMVSPVNAYVKGGHYPEARISVKVFEQARAVLARLHGEGGGV